MRFNWFYVIVYLCWLLRPRVARLFLSHFLAKINIDLHRDFIFIFVISFQFYRLLFILLYRLFRNILWVYILNFKDFSMNDHFCNIFQYIFHLLNRYVLRFIICCAIIVFILKNEQLQSSFSILWITCSFIFLILN